MKKIAIICELKERELPYLSILLKKFELLEYNVKIIPQRILCGLKIIRYKPDFIFINGLRSDNNFIRQILLPKQFFNSTIISFYTEQVGKDGGLAKTYNNTKILNSIDAHIVWGDKFANGLIQLGVKKEKIWILGALSLDLPFYLRSKKDIIRENLSNKYKIDKEKKWILVADNIIRRNKQPHLYSSRREEFDNCIKYLATELGDLEIIFRPHPDTKIKDYRNLLISYRNLRNVKFISHEHIIMWILQSEAMVIWRSTSSIEAWLNGIEVFAFRTSDRESDYWHENYIQNFNEKEELVKNLKAYINDENIENKKFLANRNSYIKDWFYETNGKSFDRVTILLKYLDDNNIGAKVNYKSNFLQIIRTFYFELNTLFAKIIKRDYKRFNVRINEIQNELQYFEIDKTNPNDFVIKKGEFGNYIENRM